MAFKILDCHVHTESDQPEQAALLARLAQSRVGELIVMSLSPACFPLWRKREYSNRERLDILLDWCKGTDKLHPVYWVDPTEDDAEAQLEAAAERGVQGFKVMCGNHYPGDPRAMKAYRRMAKLHKSVMFHSGILWDGQASARYNRPAEFEDLIGVEGLKFALAHISWPWVDECVALFGKLENARNFHHLPVAEMFIDTTPGTPEIYRREALYRLLKSGCHVEKSVFFGSDQNAESYDPAVSESIVDCDLAILGELGISGDTAEDMFANNVRSFYGF